MWRQRSGFTGSSPPNSYRAPGRPRPSRRRRVAPAPTRRAEGRQDWRGRLADHLRRDRNRGAVQKSLRARRATQQRLHVESEQDRRHGIRVRGRASRSGDGRSSAESVEPLDVAPAFGVHGLVVGGGIRHRTSASPYDGRKRRSPDSGEAGCLPGASSGRPGRFACYAAAGRELERSRVRENDLDLTRNNRVKLHHFGGVTPLKNL